MGAIACNLLGQSSPLAQSAKVLAQSKTGVHKMKPYAFQSHATNVVYFVGTRDANSRTWLKVITTTDAKGQTHSRTNIAYIELASGMHYWENNQWKESKEIIEPFSGGAIARYGQHKVIFANNLNTVGAIDMQTPDGKELRSDVLGLSYYDSSSGNSVLIAQVKDSQGQIVGSNQVIYADAFVGVAADVRYTYRRGGFEQDIILQSQPPSPQNYGLNPATTRLQVLTEFLNPPQPAINTFAQPDGTVNELLDFGAMKMGLGKAFSIGGNEEIPVAKRWTQIDERYILIESVPLTAMQSALQALPQNVSVKSGSNSKLYAVSKKQLLPAKPMAKKKDGAMLVAKASLPNKGFVLDYATLIGNQPANYTFKGDTTYYISGYVGLSGTSVFEPGTVVKYAPGAYIGGSVIKCQGTSYSPVIFTARDDDSIGENLRESTGNGPQGYYAAYVFSITGSTLPTFSNFRVLYASCGLSLNYYGSNPTITNAQFVNCQTAFQLEDSGVNVRNSLFSDVSTVFSSVFQAQQTTWSVQNVTIDGANYVLYNGNSGNPFTQLTFYNSIFANTTHIYNSGNLAVSGSYNGFFNCPQQIGSIKFTASASPFQSSAGGNYYLTTASGFRGKGTTSVDPALLADLKTKTTYPPVALPALMEVTGDLTLFPQIPRYSGNTPPDLGYNYDILDYTISQLIVNGGSITVQPGTTIGVYNEYLPANNISTWWGFILREGSSFVSHGTPTKPNIFTDVQLVQEQSTPPAISSFLLYFYPNDQGLPAPSMDFQFCNFYASQRWYQFWGGYDEGFLDYAASPDALVYWNLRDCNIYGGRISLGNPDDGTYFTFPWNNLYGTGAILWENNLFNDVNINVDPTYYWSDLSTVNCDMQLQAYNNLFRGGIWFHLGPNPTSAGNWVVEDNLFDQIDFVQNTSAPLDFDYNAYWPLTSGQLAADYNLYLWNLPNFAELQPTTTGDGFMDGSHEHVLSSAPPYQTGPLGNYYLPTTTPLYNAGSRSAADANLAQYTTQQNQTKDSGQVDIGLHYVATSSSTSATPKDTDADGIPDYVEDANGDGQFESGSETDWQHNYSTTDPTTGQPVADAYSTIYDDVDLDGDGMVGRIEKALGKNPLVSDNPLTLTQVITGNEPNTITFRVPINYSLVDYNLENPVGKLSIWLDGMPLSVGYEPDNNGQCLATWNATFSPPGFHILQAEFDLNKKIVAGPAPDPTVIVAKGQSIVFVNQNGIQFDPLYCEYSDSDGAILYATTPTCPDATYTIELQTPDGNHIKWLAVNQTTSSGEISVPWNLTYDDNTTVYTGDSVKAAFNVTLLDPGSYTATLILNKVNTLPVDGNFTIAYACDNSADNSNLRNCMQWTVVDQLIGTCNATFCYDYPYSSTFNTWSDLGTQPGNPGHLANNVDVGNLLQNLQQNTTRNFYFFGHGDQAAIGTADPDDVTINATAIAGALGNHDFAFGNNPGTGVRGKRYRFVFLDACFTAYTRDFCYAFGIKDRITSERLALLPYYVQAFVGWTGEKVEPTAGNMFDMANCYTVFWAAWQSGLPLDRCIWYASQANPPAPLNFEDLSAYNFGPNYQNWDRYFGYYYWRLGITGTRYPRLRIYGYAGITRTGFAPGFDFSDYYK